MVDNICLQIGTVREWTEMVLESLAAVMPLLIADHTNLKQLHLVLQPVYNLLPCNCCGLSFGLLLHVRVMKYVGLLPEVPCIFHGDKEWGFPSHC